MSIEGIMITELSLEDLDFRPASYFWPITRETHLICSIKGERRRELVRDALEQGLTPLEARYAAPALDDADRAALERLHPSFMGGEYLPDRRETEAEIARICVQSVTCDVVCVYARPVGERLHYRVVDEYGGETLEGRCTRTSLRPLKLREVVRFLMGAWNIFDVLQRNDYDLNRMHDFVRPTSAFYPNFDRATWLEIEGWYAEMASKSSI